MKTSKYIDAFVEEARENIESLNQVLMVMEKKGYDEQGMYKAYRLVHTLKGNANVLGIDFIGEIAHSMEDVLDLLKEKKKTPRREMLDLLFESSDLVERMVGELVDSGGIMTDGKETIKRLRELTAHIGGRVQKKRNRKKVSGKRKKPADTQIEFTDALKERVVECLEQGQSIYELTVTMDDGLSFKEGRVFQLLRKISTLGYIIASAPDTDNIDDDITELKILFATKEEKKALKLAASDITGIEILEVEPLELPDDTHEVADNDQIPDDTAQDEKGSRSRKQSGFSQLDTVRVKSKLLDLLLDLVGEIMISDIRFNQIAIDLKNRELKQVLKNRERLMSELQDIVLRMRMIPIDYIFKRFPRMMRDMSKESGKRIDFETTGNDMEIDRSLLDNIGDSLVHILRNAVDHGIESEKEREKAGKEPVGSVILSAYREQSSIVIEVDDDGRGLDPDRIVEKAVEKGVISSEEARNLDGKQRLALAFRPTVSTASKVTEVSGRGVGLDVVKNRIESLAGTVKLVSEKGKGTKFFMKLPPSMSIISAMLVEVNDEKYGIPLENVNETTRIPAADIHEFSECGMFRLRDEILPILNVHKEFGGEIQMLEEDMPVVIVEKDEERAGLIVTKLIGQQEIVVKTMSKELASQQYFSGATILGDGRVAMILDVGALI